MQKKKLQLKKLVSILIIVSMMFAFAPMAGASHTGEDVILQNDNFELDEEGNFLHWETDGAEYTEEFRRHGTGSLFFKSSDPESVISASQVVSVKGGYLYNFNGFFHDAMGDNPDRYSEVTVHYLDADGEEISSQVAYRFDADTEDGSVYKKFEAELITPPNAAEARIYLYGTNYEGFFLYDWFHLNEVGEAPEVIPYVDVVLQNDNFDDLDEDGVILHWETDGAHYVEGMRRHGPGSLRFPSDNPESVIIAQQTLSINPEYVYNLVGYFHDAMGDNPDRYSEVKVYYLNQNGDEIGSDVLYRFDADTEDESVYKRFEKNFVTSADTREILMELSGANYEGMFLYDWFQMEETGHIDDVVFEVPDAPEALHATMESQTELTLRWGAPEGQINNYIVYRDGEEIGTSSNVTFEDTVTPDTEYTYTVVAVNDAGESEVSEALVTIADFYVDVTPPDQPSLQADAESDTKIFLRWRSVHDDVTVAGHDIYRDGELIDTVTELVEGMYEDTELTPGTTYEYSVVAFDAAGNRSEASNTAVGTTFEGDDNQYVKGLMNLNYYLEGTETAEIIYRLGPGYSDASGLTAQAVVHLPDEEVTYTETIEDFAKTTISVPLADLANGVYTVSLSILNGEGVIWATEDSLVIHPKPAENTRVTQIDQDRLIMLVDGEPFFPLGVFGVHKDSLQQIADAGFNTTLRWKGNTTQPRFDHTLPYDDPYNEAAVTDYLDAVEAAGIYAFETRVKLAQGDLYHKYRDAAWNDKYPVHNELVTPGVVSHSATQPAVVGYYNYDEVDNFYECCPQDVNHLLMQDGVEEWYDVVKELDPYHSVMTLFAVGMSKNADWRAWDIAAMDSYYGDHKHMSSIYRSFKNSTDVSDAWNYPFIATPLFEEQSAQRKPLNAIQQRASTYTAVVAGARGVYWWDWAAVYNENWKMLQQLVGEINEMQPILTERTPLQTIEYADGSVQATDSGMSNSAQALVKNHDDKSYLITVNTEEAPVEVTYSLPEQYNDTTGTVWFEDREIKVVNGTFTDTYEPFARHVYELPATWNEGDAITMDVQITGDYVVYVDPEYEEQTKNLLENNSFEYSYGSTPGSLAEWFNGDSVMHSETSDEGRYYMDNTQAYHGDGSLRLTTAKDGEYDDIHNFEVTGTRLGVKYPRAGDYTFSIYLKADQEDTVVTLQENWETYKEVKVGTEWERYSVTINRTAPGGSFVAVWVMDAATVWIDAAQVEAATEPTAYEPTVLSNPHEYTGGNATRAGFAKLLSDALKLEGQSESNPFTDIPDDASLISGMSATEFSPNTAITREQMAALLVRAYEYSSGQSIESGDNLGAYTDESNISNWAKAEVSKAIAAGLVQGNTENTFGPKSKVKYSEVQQSVNQLLNN